MSGQELLPMDEDDSVAQYLDFAGQLASLLPGPGGAVGAFLGGLATDRKVKRIRELIEGLDEDLRGFKSKVSQEYVRTEDFEDLFEEVVIKTARERSDAKRRIYREFIVNAIKMPGFGYDEQFRILRTIEQLQPDHLLVIQAMLQEPDPEGSERYRSMSGSLLQTLQQRLPDMQADRIEDLAGQLTDELRLVTLGSALKTMMTASGAADLRNRFTAYGQRLVEYIRASDEEAGPR